MMLTVRIKGILPRERLILTRVTSLIESLIICIWDEIHVVVIVPLEHIAI